METKLTAILPEHELIHMYEQMVLCREFEESCAEQYTKGHITGFLHLYSGQEAVAVGTTRALHKDDYICSAYREHAQAIVRGAEPRRVMAELFGKATGICKGKGDRCTCSTPSFSSWGATPSSAASSPSPSVLPSPPNTGRRDRISACFFGDGAVNQGNFHEGLNWARLWELPVLFICENNFYGIGTEVHRSSAIADIHKRTCGYDIPSQKVDGMDVIAVYQAVKHAAEWVREHSRPYLIEAMTYRFRGHSMSDPAKYRSPAEHAIWKERDPIPNFEKRLLEEGIATRDDINAMKEKALQTVREAVKFAEDSPWPDDSEVYTDIYV